MKNKKLVRFIAILLSILLCAQLCTTIVFAEEAENTEVAADSVTDEYEPQLIGELTDRRTANEKYFLYDDQTIVAAVYPTAVHYADEEGALQDIDNRLTEGDTEYENGKSLWKVKLAKKAKDGKLVKLKYGSHNIVWSLNGAEKTEAVAIPFPESEADEDPLKLAGVSSGVLYEDILENTDLEYYLIGDRIKENLILKSADAPDSFTFVYETGDLEMSLEDNTLFIKDGENVVLMLDAPVMTDAALEESMDITLSLHEYKATAGNHMYAVTVIPDAEWLAEKERVYPVTVDPVLTTEQTHSAIEDTHAASSAPDQVRSDWTTTKVGMHTTANIYRAFLKFDLPSELSVGDRVVAANLTLWPNTTYGDLLTMAEQQPVIQAHEVTEDWDKDTLTWNNQPDCNENTVIDYDMISGTTNDEVGRWYTWNITELVDKWYTTGNNYGVMLKYNNETSYGSNMVTNFVSAETNVTTEAFPCITVRYVNTSGLEDYYTYHSVGVGHAGTAYINDFTGAMTLVTPIAGIASERAPVNISLVYTPGSNDTTINKLNVGNDFMLNLQAYMDTVEDDSGNILRYKYVDGDGTAHYFKQESGKWVDEDGLGYELTIGTTYLTVTAKDDSIIEFYKSNGRLYRTADHNQDGNGNRVNYTKLTYSGDYLSSVTNGTQTITIDRYTQNNKQHIKFTYPDSDGRDRYTLIVLTEHNNHIENIFQYVQVNGVDTEQSRVGFQYSNRAIVSVIDGTFMQAARFGYTTTNDNDPKTRRVTSYNYCPYNGNGTFGTNLYSYTVSYDQRSTKYTTTPSAGDTRYELYTFDSLGRTITGQDHNGNAVFQEYGISGGAENKVTFSSGSQRSVTNLALNHNFEKSGTTHWYFVKGASSDNYAIKGTALSEPTYIGALGMKVYQHSATSANRATAKQSVTLTGGKVYTLSAYVKTAFTTVGSDTNAGACIAVERLSTPLSQHYRHAIISPSGYTRHFVTIDLTGNEFVEGDPYSFDIILGTYKVAGVAYFDCVQLEEGGSVNSYNLVENAGFENTSDTTSWIKQNMGDVDGVISSTKNSGSYGFKFTGNPKLAKRMYQSIPVSGVKDNAFTAGVWVKTNTVPDKDFAIDEDEDGNQQTCGITVEICHTDGSKQYETATIPNACSQWRYVCLGIVASEAFSSVNIYLKYPYNCNTTYFDDICLFADAFGQSYTYDDNTHQIKSSTDRANNETKVTYTAKNEIQSYTDGNGEQYSFTYKSDNAHLVDTVTDPKDMDTRYTYNGYGQPTVVDVESTGGLRMQTSVAYTSDGHYVTSETDTNGAVTKYTRSSATGRLNALRIPASTSGRERVTDYIYDELTDELLHVDVGVFDGDVYTESLIDISYAYNRGNLTEIIRSANDTKQMGYHISYDTFGRTEKVEWSGKNNTKYILQETEYKKWTSLPQKVTYGNGQEINYLYDANDLLLSKSDATKEIEGYSYNANNALGSAWYLSDAGKKINTYYFYDLAGRTAGMKTDDGFSTDGYTYDKNNNLTAYRSALKSGIFNLAYTTQYVYNESNNITRLKLHMDDGTAAGKTDGTIRYGYDGLGRLTTKKVTLENTSATIGETTEKAIKSTYTYKTHTVTENGTDITMRHLQPSTVTFSENFTTDSLDTYNELVKYYNTFAPDGSLSRMRVTEGGVHDYTHYRYDDLGQLTTWKNTGTNASYSAAAAEQYTYTYDNGGNLTGSTYTGANGNYTASYTYDGNFSDLLTSYVKKDASNSPILTKTYSYTTEDGDLFVNPTAITQTENGATTTWNLSWEQGRQLDKITDGSNVLVADYDYNESGLRTYKKQADGSEYFYHYSGSRLEYVRIVTSAGSTFALHYFYNNAGQAEYILLKQSYKSTYSPNHDLFYIVRDSTGAIDKLYKVRGGSSNAIGCVPVFSLAVDYEYDPYGRVLVSGTSKIALYNPLIYKDYVYDYDTELYYLQSRYYDPEVGRFINADAFASTGQDLIGTNMFAYCGNNPVNRVDHTGQFWSEIWEFAKTAVAEIGKAMGVMSPAYAGCGGAAVADGPLPFGDIVAAAGAALLTVGAIGYGIYQATQAPAISVPKVEEKSKDIVIPKEPDNPVIFPVDPNTFNPVGLVKVHRAGTKNGAFISWMDPLTNTEVFRWDENPNYSNGSHYHIHGTGHYYPGMIVPEPYATIYFPVG